ncbi:MAG: hypothetical protein R6V55_12470 [Desulfovermiculus sp.]
MDKDPGSKKTKIRAWAPYLSLITAVLIAIAFFIDPDTLGMIALIFALINVGVHYKDFLRG